MGSAQPLDAPSWKPKCVTTGGLLAFSKAPFHENNRSYLKGKSINQGFFSQQPQSGTAEWPKTSLIRLIVAAPNLI